MLFYFPGPFILKTARIYKSDRVRKCLQITAANFIDVQYKS